MPTTLQDNPSSPNTVNPSINPSTSTAIELSEHIVSVPSSTASSTTTLYDRMGTYDGLPELNLTNANKNRRRTSSADTFGCQPLHWPAIIINMAVRFVIWSLFAFVLSISIVDVPPGKELFSWHPPLLTLAFCLASESILCFADGNVATRQLSHTTRVRLHWMLQTAAALCTAVGFTAVVVHKLRFGKAHFHTWHGRYGLAAVLTIVVAAGSGAVANYAIPWSNRWRPQAVKCMHGATALLNYKLTAVAMLLGAYSSWFGKHAKGSAWMVAYLVAVAVVAVYVGAKPMRTLWTRSRSLWRRAYTL